MLINLEQDDDETFFFFSAGSTAPVSFLWPGDDRERSVTGMKVAAAFCGVVRAYSFPHHRWRTYDMYGNIYGVRSGRSSFVDGALEAI